MKQFEYDLGVIGAGAAGLTVAAGAARLGAKTLLVEKEEKLGGDCLHYGCVPSKTLIKSSTVYHHMKQAGRYGLPQPDVPPVDFRRVRERIRSVIDAIQPHDSPERFCGLGVRVEFGRAAFIDEHTVSLNSRTVTAKNWLIATGSTAAIPPVEGLADTSYITNKEIFYLDCLPESMIVLGAGPIAMEMAQAFCRLGSRVQVVQRSNQILSREDKDIADTLTAVLEQEGVQFFLGSKVHSVQEKGGQKEVVISQNGGEPFSLQAETLLVALGRKPSLDELDLEKAGVAYDLKGLHLDARLRTTQKHIYGAGDVTGTHQFTHAAGYEGGIVLSNAVFHLPRKVNYTYLPWCTYTGPELASIGLNERRAKQAGINYSVWVEEFRDNDRSLAEGDHTGTLKLLLDEKEKPLGVQILGPHAGELINEWVATLNGSVKLSTLASSVHPYPTLGEINKRVCGSYLSPKIFSDTVRKGLKLFFNLKGRAKCD